MPETKVVPAADQFGALLAMQQALAGEVTLFIAAEPREELTPSAYSLADSYEDVALIVETSGSTAAPKRVALSADALLASARATEQRLGGGGTWLLTLPTNYIAGAQVLVRSVLADTQPVMMNQAVPFTAEGFARMAGLLSGERLYTSLVPTQLHRLAVAVDHDEYLLRQLLRFDAILVGGQAPDPLVLQKLRSLGVKLVVTYGSSESAGGCVYDGVPLEGVSVRVNDGVIELGGNTLASGYLDADQNLTDAAAFYSAGGERWYRTSDLGSFEDGKLRVIGRADRVFISGGVKVSLDELETAAAGLAGVVQVAAVALRDAEWGERAALLYVGSPEVADDLAGAVLSNLGPAANPVRVIRVDELPRLANGKTDYLGIVAYFESA